MTKYIDKSALVAEIERRLNELYNMLPDTSEVENGVITISDVCNTGKYTALESFKDYLDTLEVKEVDTIEREVKEDAGGYPFIEATELYDYDSDKPLAKAGDKVKIMFIKD